jgi:hypothetical protein
MSDARAMKAILTMIGLGAGCWGLLYSSSPYAAIAELVCIGMVFLALISGGQRLSR